VSDTDLGLPDLDDLPTQPPPPPPPERIDDGTRRRNPPRPPSPTGRPSRLLALILATQASLVSSAVLVAIGRPSAVVAVIAVVLANVFMVAAFSIMLGLAGRGR
jgi:hypothetical protein